MTETYNVADLKPDDTQPDPKPYYIDSILYQENPYDHLPEGCSLVSWNDITNFTDDITLQ